MSDHAEINYSDVQNSKENMRNISTVTYFAQLEIPPKMFVLLARYRASKSRMKQIECLEVKYRNFKLHENNKEVAFQLYLVE